MMFLGHRIFYSSPTTYLFGVQIERNLLSDQKDEEKKIHIDKALTCYANGSFRMWYEW